MKLTEEQLLQSVTRTSSSFQTVEEILTTINLQQNQHQRYAAVTPPRREDTSSG